MTDQVLAEELTAKKLFTEAGGVGGWNYLIQITQDIPTVAHAPFFIDKIIFLESRRKTIRDAWHWLSLRSPSPAPQMSSPQSLNPPARH